MVELKSTKFEFEIDLTSDSLSEFSSKPSSLSDVGAYLGLNKNYYLWSENFILRLSF